MKPTEMVYLSGPMTGIPDENRPAFRKGAELLRSWGFNVISPDELDALDPVDQYKPSWADYLRRDLSHLRHATSCVLLPGWRQSRGARLEVTILHQLGVPIFELVGEGDSATLNEVNTNLPYVAV